MALFKISKGVKANLPSTYTEGYCYFTTDDGKFYIDTTNTVAGRILLNAGKADQLSTARTISLTGDVTGSASFDGSSNISITATVANDSHTHSASNISSGTLAAARLPAATTSAQGAMTAAMVTKLNSIAEGANNYSLPTASSSTLGGVKTTSTVTSTSGLTACPIISGVPYYKDTNTTYSAGTGISLSGTTFSYDPGNMSGGYNYCFDTDTGTHWGWSHQSGGTTVSTGTSHGCNTAIIQRDATEASGWAYLYYNAVDLSKLEDGKEYYWCFDVYSSLECSIGLLGIMNGSGTGNIANVSAIRNSIPAKTWTTCIYKLTINIGTTSVSGQLMYMSVSRRDPGMQLIFKNPRLVRGNMGSGYTNIESKYIYLNNNNFTTYITPAAIGAAKASHTHNYIGMSGKAAINCNTQYDTGYCSIGGGSNCPSGNQYGSLLTMAYRKQTENTTPDFATQLFIPNGDDSTQPDSMYYRTSGASSWRSWQRVLTDNNLKFSLSGTTLTITKS